MTDQQTAQYEPVGEKWKKKRYFDGSTCGLVGCKRAPDGYVCDTKPTGKEKDKVGRLWFGPACKKCMVKLGHNEGSVIPFKELARQRGGASDLALVLDIEVGDVLKRLEAAGIDEQGSTIGGEPQVGVAQPGVEQPPVGPETGLAPGQPLVIPPPEQPTPTPAANTGAGAPVGAQLTIPEPAPNNGAPAGLAVVTAPSVQMPTEVIQGELVEANGVLAQLAVFHVVDQKTMDDASGWLKEVKKKWNALDETRKALGRPLRDALEEIQTYFNPPLNALKKAETLFKQKISEGSARALQAQQAALDAAQQALQAGNTPGVAIASQAAAAADVELPRGISQRMITKFEIVDVTQLPAWAWSPDANKVQAAINMGWTEIPGVRIWQEPSISART